MHRYAIITSFLGTIANRYMTYQGERPLAEKLALAAEIAGADGVELCYPGDFGNVEELRALLERYRLGVSAINFRSRRNGAWLRGSFSSPHREERREVLEDLKRVMDHAAALGCNRVTTCPLNDGSDVPFEMDYLQAYDDAAEVLRAACDHDRQVRICIEYKKSDPMARCLFGNAGETAALCGLVNASNLGVTLDVGHAMLAEERPAQSAALLHRTQRLFYVHLNDNDGRWDWDMIPGVYHIWEFIELFMILRQIGYEDDWFGFDVFSKEIPIAQTLSTAIGCARSLERLSQGVDMAALAELRQRRNPTQAARFMLNLLGLDAHHATADTRG
jgi:xylose isomerase